LQVRPAISASGEPNGDPIRESLQILGKFEMLASDKHSSLFSRKVKNEGVKKGFATLPPDRHDSVHSSELTKPKQETFFSRIVSTDGS
jgi:hypothetical protein